MWKTLNSSCAKLIGLDLTHSQERYVRTLQKELVEGARWLDIGCGRQIVPLWASPLREQAAMVQKAGIFAGLDTDDALLEHPLLKYRVIGIGQHLPFQDQSFDLITANMVFEHLEHPEEILREIHRVLSPGGKLIFHTPNYRYPYIFIASLIGDSIKKPLIWILERRQDKDVFKTFYHSNTVGTVKRLAASEFEVVDVRVGGSVGTFQRLGPLGLVELPFLKLLSMGLFNRFNATITAILRKPAALR